MEFIEYNGDCDFSFCRHREYRLMTFYEAALHVLEAAGTPLHATEITKRALAEGLLSHVGRLPEVTMLARLSAMARRSRERRVLVSALDTFALTDWMIPEDPEALAATGASLANPEEDDPPYRPEERHPEPHPEFVRTVGRQSDRRRGRDEPATARQASPAEAAFGVLQEVPRPLSANEVLDRLGARERGDVDRKALFEALYADNQARIDSNRAPQFIALTVDGEVQLRISSGDAEQRSPAEIQEAFRLATGVVASLAEREPHHVAADEGGNDAELELFAQARFALRESRRGFARWLRRKVASLDAPTFDRVCVRLLHALKFREVKGARRGSDVRTFTARRRDGSLELRYAIQVTRGSHAVDRRQVADFRSHLEELGANIGLIISPQDARGDGRAEAVENGALILLWCGEGLGEKMLEAHLGVKVTNAELYEFDPIFFEVAAKDADELRARRDERMRPRGADGAVTAGQSIGAAALPRQRNSDSLVPAEQRKRRRGRRRRRGGRGPGGDATGHGVLPAPQESGAAATPIAEAQAAVEVRDESSRDPDPTPT